MDFTSIGFWLTTHLGFLNRWADWWNIKVRIPIARFLARRLMFNRRQNPFIGIFSTVITIWIMLSLLTLYSLPVAFLLHFTQADPLISGLITFAFIYWIFEEESRLLRKVGQAIDERAGNKPYGKGKLYPWPAHNRNTLNAWSKGVAVVSIGLLTAVAMQLGAIYDKAHVPNTSSNVEVLNLVAQAHPILLLVITWFMAPVIEELFFKGIVMRVFMYTGYNDNLPLGKIRTVTLIALTGQAALFSYAHSPNTLGYAAALFLAGFLLGSLTVVTGRVKYAAYAHMFANISGVLVSALFAVVAG